MTKQEIKRKFRNLMEVDAAQRCTIVATIMEIYDRYECTPAGLRDLGDALDWIYFTTPEKPVFGPYTRDELETLVGACVECLRSIEDYNFGFGMYEENLNPFKIWDEPAIYTELKKLVDDYLIWLRFMLRSFNLIADAPIVGKLADASAN